MFYKRFIHGFSTIAILITKCLKKIKLKWREEQEASFTLLKEKLSTALLLDLPNFNKLLAVEYDVSCKVISVILSQKGQPIEYVSEKLNEAQ